MPRSVMRSLAARSSDNCSFSSSGRMPSRPSPVSTSTSTISGDTPRKSAASSSATTAGEVAGTPISSCAASRRYSLGTRQRTRSGALNPARRSWSASSTVATSTERAPAAIEARAICTAPRPYAFDFSTTSRWPPSGRRAFRLRTLFAIASRLTSTHAARASGGSPAARSASGIPILMPRVRCAGRTRQRRRIRAHA